MRSVITGLFLAFAALVIIVTENQVSFRIFEYNNIWLDITVWDKNRYFLWLLGVCSIPVSLFSHLYYKIKKFHWFHNLTILIFGVICFFLFSTTNLITFVVLFEATSIFSYVLLAVARHENRLSAARIVFITTVIGGTLSVFFGAYIYLELGSTDITQITQSHILSSYIAWIALVIICTKSAIFPFGFWLIKAMVAETPVSAYLHSATLVKLGLYFGYLFSNVFAESHVCKILEILGCISALVYSYKAFYSENLKVALAYSTLASLGILAYFLAVNDMEPFNSFLISHGIYKSTLFILFGIFLLRTRLTSVTQFGSSFTTVEKILILVPLFSLVGISPTLTSVVKKYIIIDVFNASEIFVLSFSLLGSLFFISGFGARLLISLVFKNDTSFRSYGFWVILISSINVFINQVIYLKNLLQPQGHEEISIVSNFLLILSFIFAYFQPVYPETPKPKKFSHFIKDALNLLSNYLQPQKLSIYISHFFMFALLLVMISKSNPTFDRIQFTLSPTLILFLCIVAVGAFLAVRSEGRIMTVLSFALIGLVVNLNFLMFGAPDLALTSFFVDILWLALIIQALNKLPPFQKIPKAKFQTRHLAISVAVGFMAFILAIEPNAKSLSKVDYLSYSYLLLHAENVVNGIVVGFRGLDTVVEITVLCLCSLGFIWILKK